MIAPILVAIIMTIFIASQIVLAPIQGVMIFVIASVAAFIGWLLVSYRTPVE